jgi:hypothetical protein
MVVVQDGVEELLQWQPLKGPLEGNNLRHR